jgi:5-formyltetrahydrofolate cyclo-ligase
VTGVDLTSAKAAARTAAFRARAAAHAVGPGAACDHLAEVLAPHAGKVLAGYMAMRSEIDPLPVMAAHGGPVCVPVIVGKGQPLAFRAWSPGCVMVDGAFGARIPEAGDWLVPQVLIVPLVAFDASGFRLGYGGGFYDRTLERLRAAGEVLAIGFAYAAQEMADLPLEPTDQPLDLIVTEQGVLRPPHRR